MSKPVAIQMHSKGHYIDHLAPLCAMLKIPFLFHGEKEFEEAVNYYPSLDAQLLPMEEFFPHKLASNYDALFSSFCMDRRGFEESYPGMKSVFIPHGNSDKGTKEDLKLFLEPHFSFLYGKRMVDFLQTHGIQVPHAFIGNYRYDYYLKNRDFYDNLLQKDVFDHLSKNKKTILYAPTWGSEGTFFDIYEYLFNHLPSDYQIIVKLHPYMREDHLGQLIRIVGSYENNRNILFLEDYPLIYPLLSKVDIYLGDTSSIGYDFLTFNRPQFFLNKSAKNLFLHSCGTVIEVAQFDTLYKIIEEALPSESEKYSVLRKKIYDYTFEKEVPPCEQLRLLKIQTPII